jgi:hypothetical protein
MLVVLIEPQANDCHGLTAAVSRIAAILPNDLAPTNMNGPLLPFAHAWQCCGAARQTGLSLQPQNLMMGEFKRSTNQAYFRIPLANVSLYGDRPHAEGFDAFGSCKNWGHWWLR